MNISLSPFAPENLVQRDRFGRPVPRQPARPPHSGCTWCLFTGFFPLSTVASIYSYLQPSLDQSRVYQITKLCTDGVHCRRGYAGIGPLVLKVVPVTGAAFSGITMDQLFIRSSFPTPTFGMKWACVVHTVSEAKRIPRQGQGLMAMDSRWIAFLRVVGVSSWGNTSSRVN